MPCIICGDARGCEACRLKSDRLRRRVEAEPEFREAVAAKWRERTGAPAANPHQLRALLASACDYNAGRPASCGCASKVVCLAGRGGLDGAAYTSDCVACELGGPAHEAL